MKKLFLILAILGFIGKINSQTILGELVDHNNTGISGLSLKLHIDATIYTTTTLSDGSFAFNNVVDIREKNELPTGFSVSNNYPNPFNPKTRIPFSLPNQGNIKISIFNSIGQKVGDDIDRDFNAGDNFVDLELDGLPNGAYYTRIIFENKYVVTKKIMLVYGTRHLNSLQSSPFMSSSQSTKYLLTTKLDSLVATSSLGKKVFTNLPNFTSGTLSLGVLVWDMSVPQPPILVYPANGTFIHNTTPILNWSESNRTNSYILQIADNIDFNNVTTHTNIADKSFQVSGLAYNKTYYWRVSAVNEFGTSEYSSVFNFKTINLLSPTIPILISPENTSIIHNTSPVLSWNASNGATSYTLQIADNQDFNNPSIHLNITSTSKQITGLSFNKFYYWRVSATNSYGTSAYSNVWSFRTILSLNVCGAEKVNYGGKTYNTVLIGNQCWLKENLNIGTMINGGYNQTNNATIEKYCYDNKLENCDTYGGLYQWNEAMQYSIIEGSRGICPEGWHIPTKAELVTLAATVNQNSDALMAIGQGNGTNTSGFSVLLSGVRSHDASFKGITSSTQLLSSEGGNAGFASYMRIYMFNSSSNLEITNRDNKIHGFSIRCIKNK